VEARCAHLGHRASEAALITKHNESPDHGPVRLVAGDWSNRVKCFYDPAAARRSHRNIPLRVRLSPMTSRPPPCPERFTALPGEHTLHATVVAPDEHGFSVEDVYDLDAARNAAVARISEGSSVMTNTPVTLAETGIAVAINDGRRYDSATRLAAYARVAADVIFVVGPHKLVPTLDAVHQRIYAHRLSQEDARAHAAYGQHSQVGEIREIHQELPGRIHIVLIRQPVGF
jgi:hypothetical protein